MADTDKPSRSRSKRAPARKGREQSKAGASKAARGSKKGASRSQSASSSKAGSRKQGSPRSTSSPRSQKDSNGSGRPSRQSEERAQRSAGHGSRNGLSTLDVVQNAREYLGALLGRPVEQVLGADRSGSSWTVTAQVVELARIPNTTDVLGEYEAVLDRRGDVVSFRKTRRYNRGHIEERQS